MINGLLSYLNIILIVGLFVVHGVQPASSAATLAAALQTADQAALAMNVQLTQLTQSISSVPLSSLQSTLAAAANVTTGAVALSTALNAAYVATGKTGTHPDANKLLANFLQATDMVVKSLAQRLTAPVAPDTVQAAFMAATATVTGSSPSVSMMQFLLTTLAAANSALAGDTGAIQEATTYYSAYPTHPDIITLQASFLQGTDTVIKQLAQSLLNPVSFQASLAAPQIPVTASLFPLTSSPAQAVLLIAANDPVFGVTPLLASMQAANTAVSSFLTPANAPGVPASVIQMMTTLYSTAVEHPDAVALQVAFLQAAYGVVNTMTQQLNSPVAPNTLQAVVAAATNTTMGASVMTQTLQMANNALTGNTLALPKASAWYSTVIPHPAIALLNNALTKAQATAQSQAQTQTQNQQQQAQSQVSAQSPQQTSVPVTAAAPAPNLAPTTASATAPSSAQAASSAPAPAAALTPATTPVKAPSTQPSAQVPSATPAAVVAPAPPPVQAPVTPSETPPVATPPVVPPANPPITPPATPPAAPSITPPTSAGGTSIAVQLADQAVTNLFLLLNSATDPVSQQNALNAANNPVTGATPAITALNAAYAAAGGTPPHPDATALTSAMIAVATAIASQTSAGS